MLIAEETRITRRREEMAKKNFTHKKTLTTQITINGVLSSDANGITYIDDDGMETTITLKDAFKPLGDCDVKMTAMAKCESDIEDES